ncbi:MAG: MHYT domain-containing protein [Pseudomonadota bacterium]
MQFLDVSHSPGLVAASIAIAIISGFTGLNLTKDLSSKTYGQRKVAVALAAVALGGGIWSMHFVAMLGLQMPILFYYDAAITLASALLAILIVASALILLHFTQRTRAHIYGAGALVGVGITAMHYVGMSGLELCRAVTSPLSMMSSAAISVLLCIVAFYVAYHERSDKNLILGTLCFGAAVSAVHFIAVFKTQFVAVEGFSEFGPAMSNEVLAIGVTVSSFLILGTFLWVSTAYLSPSPVGVGPTTGTDGPAQPVTAKLRIPCEKDGSKIFVPPEEVAFVRADGRYSQVYTDKDRFFCALPITMAAERLLPAGHLQVHRSYVVNPEKIASFERKKDNGVCHFRAEHCPKVPVSRSKLKMVQENLGI